MRSGITTRAPGCTILSLPLGIHKGRRAALGLAIGLALSSSAVAQDSSRRPVVTTGQALSFVGAGVVWGTSLLLDANVGPPTCAPCDPATLPWFDRWAVGNEKPAAARASDLLLVGLAAGALWGTSRGEDGTRRAVISLESAAWTMAITQVSKALIGRERPIMYTDLALEAASETNNQRSMWSGHTATAFAFATGYWLNNPDGDLLPKLAALAAAAGVGALRVVSAKHFPSDVVVGAIAGTAGAFIVHEVRF